MVAPEDYGEGSDNDKAHPDMDKVDDVGQSAISCSGKESCQGSLGILSTLGCKAVNGVHQQNEVLAVCKAGLSVLEGHVLQSMLQHFVRESVAIGVGICITDACAEDGASGLLPASMCKDISSCFVFQGSRGELGGALLSNLAGESLSYMMVSLITTPEADRVWLQRLVNSLQASSWRMLTRPPFLQLSLCSMMKASLPVGGDVGRPNSILCGYVVKPLSEGEFGT